MHFPNPRSFLGIGLIHLWTESFSMKRSFSKISPQVLSALTSIDSIYFWSFLFIFIFIFLIVFFYFFVGKIYYNVSLRCKCLNKNDFGYLKTFLSIGHGMENVTVFQKSWNFTFLFCFCYCVLFCNQIVLHYIEEFHRKLQKVRLLLSNLQIKYRK